MNVVVVSSNGDYLFSSHMTYFLIRNNPSDHHHAPKKMLFYGSVRFCT